MSELREELMGAIKKTMNGELPIRTAETVHLTAHRVVMDKYAEIKQKESGITSEKLKDSLAKMRDV